MKSFGFPTFEEPTYKADTSGKKKELINILTREEKLWN